MPRDDYGFCLLPSKSSSPRNIVTLSVNYLVSADAQTPCVMRLWNSPRCGGKTNEAMELKAKTFGDLAAFLVSGLVTRDEWLSHLDGYNVAAVELERLTIEQYGELCETSDDIDQLSRFRSIKGGKPLSADEGAAVVCRELAALRAGMKRINAAFDAIPRVGLTAEERAAGFGKRNFGLFGLVDRLARRQSITDADARAMTVGDAIGKLTIDADESVCTKKWREIMRRKQEKQRRR